jgi:hypothetical protein
MASVQRIGIQLPRARRTGRLQNSSDLAREAVNCNAGLDGNLAAVLSSGVLLLILGYHRR